MKEPDFLFFLMLAKLKPGKKLNPVRISRYRFPVIKKEKQRELSYIIKSSMQPGKRKQNRMLSGIPVLMAKLARGRKEKTQEITKGRAL